MKYFKFQFSLEERFLRDHYNQKALITNEISWLQQLF